MGLLDNLRERLTGAYNDDYDDDYYDDYEEDEADQPAGSGILGNTPRPEAESVAVYTRSGRPVSTNAGGQPAAKDQGRAPAGSSRPSAGYSSYRRSREDFEDGFDDYAPSGSYTPAQPSSFNASGQLPPYTLRAEAYEDVQTVVRRVRTNQPVLLVLIDTPSDVAQRILDFCFGLAFGIDGEVKPVADRAFLVLPEGIQLSQGEIDRLTSQAR